jgi:paraquat-inducible protein B
MSEQEEPRSVPPASTAPPPRGDEPVPPRPVKKQWRGPSMVWLVPIIALAVGVSLIVRGILSTGPMLVIDFHSADGLRPGQTEVRYKEVVVGRVETVTLAEDRKSVQVAVRLDRSATNLAVEDTRFWVVKPRIDIGGVSGLETLLSGAYIGVDAGASSESQREFKGLENPPFFLRGEPGRGFVLRTQDLGSLDVGSPILYRRTRVGRVVGYKLDPVADELSVQVFIESPYERLVNPQTRFWNASGVDLAINASGLTVNTQTLGAVLAGGVAFERPAETTGLPPAADGSRFTLFGDRKTALAPPDGLPLKVRMVFDQSMRGLSAGAPVDFLGIEIGTVRSVRLDYDPKRKRYPVEVLADLYPARLGAARDAMSDDIPADALRDRNLIKRLVDHGVQAQARSGNLLTGQMYVALDFMPHPAKAGFDSAAPVPTIPTVPGTLSELQPQIAEIVAKINKVPFDEIGKNLDTTVRTLDGTLKQAGDAIGQLRPEAQQALAEVRKTLVSAQASLGKLDSNVLDPAAPAQRNAEQTMLDLQRAAQSLRTLTDYLERHPESLLRGKPEDPKITPR